jgi:peptide chain release factor subunit 1
MLKTFLDEIADKAKNAFMKKSREDKLLGIIIGGPGYVKDKLIDDDHLHQELQDEIIATKGLDVSGEAGLSRLVDKAEESIEDSQVVKERNLVNKFFDNLNKENGKSEYGLEQVEEALNMGAVETVLISEDVNLFRAKYECPQGHKKEVFEEKPEINDEIDCDECNEEMKLEDIGDIIDVFGEKAEEMSSDLEIISTDHEEGKRLMNMGGVAAIMRYRIR